MLSKNVTNIKQFATNAIIATMAWSVFMPGYYQLYLHYLEEFATQFGCAIHAYVLMANHVHLLQTLQRAKAGVISVVCRHISCSLTFSQRLTIST